MKIAYMDCFAGISGDMFLGALIDAGLPEDDLQNFLNSLNIDCIELQCKYVQKGALRAAKVNISHSDDKVERKLDDIYELIQKSAISQNIKEKSNSIFLNIAGVEAHIHNQDINEVHLHELGGVDTIVDITGVLWGLEQLTIERVISSPLPLGRGMAASAHGLIPVPAPATLKLLEKAAVYGKDIESELVTPTGAALVVYLASSFGSIPEMKLTSVGYGAGEREHDFPNVLRILIGSIEPLDKVQIETLSLIETNIDDLNPEIYDHVMKELFDQGAKDVYLTPIQMKKNRPATMLSVLCSLNDFDRLAGIVLRETSTTGIRKIMLERYALPRSDFQVMLPYGKVRIKSITTPDGNQKFSPEYEDCLHLAKSHGIPLLDVFQAAQRAAYENEK